jgi:hypothetical protein
VSRDQGIADPEACEPPEVAIGGPQFPDIVDHAQSRNARIVHERPHDSSLPQQRLKLHPIAFTFGEERETRRFEPGVDLIDRR